MTLLTNASSLDIQEKLTVDDGVVSVKIHDHYPYAASGLGNSDEIRIGVDQRNVYTFPGDSYLLVQATTENIPANNTFDYNGILALFTDASIYLNGQLIEHVANVQIVSTIKSILLQTPNNSVWYQQYGFLSPTSLINPYGSSFKDNKLKFLLPLCTVFGLIADFRKPILNARLELVLKRDIDDKNVFIRHTAAGVPANTPVPSIKLDSISWRIPYIQVTDQIRVWYLNSLKNDAALSIPFRAWDCYENPAVPQSTEFNWNIKMVNNSDRLLFLVVGFQTKQKRDFTKTMETFEDCGVRDIKAYLDAEYYPYDSYNADFAASNYANFYEEFIKFEPNYNKSTREGWLPTPKFNKSSYVRDYPLFVINLQYRDPALKSGGVSALKISATMNANVPDGTTAYAVLIYEKLFTYNALSEDVQRIF